jgi:glycosyltransferase involved in cell wall biosynthesis
MLVHVNKNYFARGKTGKGKFAGRLVRAWREMGIEVTEDSKVKADIALHIGRMNYESWAKRRVLRVGPACIDTNMNWRKINHEKAKSVKKADAIVYQSRYSKKIYHKLVYKPDKPETIIFNGADPREFDVEPFGRKYEYNFLASTRVWLKQKRLKQIIKAFTEAKIDDSGLIVCGDAQGLEKKYKRLSNVCFKGLCDSVTLARLYKTCDAMIHLTYVDACPNSVVEAQVAGLPVICTTQGGTKEIVEPGCGIILKDKIFDYKPMNLNKFPKIDIDELGEAMKDVMKWGKIPDWICGHVQIKNIAKQYINFFRRLV